jgi:hypothetical protein
MCYLWRSSLCTLLSEPKEVLDTPTDQKQSVGWVGEQTDFEAGCANPESDFSDAVKRTRLGASRQPNPSCKELIKAAEEGSEGRISGRGNDQPLQL